jgi:hypothetical protein
MLTATRVNATRRGSCRNQNHGDCRDPPENIAWLAGSAFPIEEGS